MKKYNILKRILLFCLPIAFIFSIIFVSVSSTYNKSIISAKAESTYTFPNPTSNKYVNDYVGILSIKESSDIIAIGKELEEKTSAQSVIVIIDSTNNVPIEDYTNKLFRAWGIGQKDKDNGLLILLAVTDKAWRVEVGRGLEGAIPDVLSNRVMESLGKSKFAEGNYGEGLLDCYSAFSDYIASEYNVTLEKSLNIQVPNTQNNTSNISTRNMGIIGIIIILLVFSDFKFNRGRIFSTLLQILFWSNIHNNHRGPFGGGGGHNNNGGGHNGGFGGGSSNGGGSSGGW